MHKMLPDNLHEYQILFYGKSNNIVKILEILNVESAENQSTCTYQHFTMRNDENYLI